MKKIILVLLALCCFKGFGQSSQSVLGQKNVRSSLVTWTAGANLLKTHGILLGNSVYVDTSTTGQANQFRRVDNTSDSCSNPFFISSDSLGGTRPVWEYRLWGQFRSVDKDSSTMVFRIQTREVFNYAATTQRAIQYGSWTIKGSNSGYADATIQDSALVPNIGTAARASQYTFFSVAGVQARFCPDDLPATANAAADTVHFDSLRVFVR